MKIRKNLYLVIDATQPFGSNPPTFGPFKNKTLANKFIKKDRVILRYLTDNIKYLIVKVKDIQKHKAINY